MPSPYIGWHFLSSSFGRYFWSAGSQGLLWLAECAKMRRLMGVVHEPPLEGSAAQGREFVYWLAEACRKLREESDTRLETIAHYSGESSYTVERFEKVKRFPHNLDAIVAAYGRVAGLTDDREIYLEAIDLWIEQGEPHSHGRQVRAEDQVVASVVSARERDAARKRRQARRGRDATPKPSTTRRRAAG